MSNIPNANTPASYYQLRCSMLIVMNMLLFCKKVMHFYNFMMYLVDTKGHHKHDVQWQILSQSLIQSMGLMTLTLFDIAILGISYNFQRDASDASYLIAQYSIIIDRLRRELDAGELDSSLSPEQQAEKKEIINKYENRIERLKHAQAASLIKSSNILNGGITGLVVSALPEWFQRRIQTFQQPENANRITFTV